MPNVGLGEWRKPKYFSLSKQLYQKEIISNKEIERTIKIDWKIRKYAEKNEKVNKWKKNEKWGGITNNNNLNIVHKSKFNTLQADLIVSWNNAYCKTTTT